MATPAGGMSRVEVDAAAIVSVEFDEASLFVGVEHEPWTREPVRAESPGASTAFELRYQSSVLQIPLDATIPQRIGPATHPCPMRRSVEYAGEYADQSYNEAHRRKRAFDGELRWYWHVDRHLGGRTVVRVYDDGGPSEPVTAFELPGVRVAHGAGGRTIRHSGTFRGIGENGARRGRERRGPILADQRGGHHRSMLAGGSGAARS
ncbi:hypothetical protein [Rhodococcus sp. Q]|uniref:hypothetical protein n=1 Tax=Rhodococcus sp. Q TaxID=2502252 RepID=UPI0010F5055F|nr:hypothetical protein [Rhodococcus sp. Q]